MAAVKKTATVKQLETKTVKKISSKPEAKRLTAKAAPKKIEAKPKAKQLTTAKAPKQITANEPAKKITSIDSKRLTDRELSKPPVKKDRYAQLDLSVCMEYIKKMGIKESIEDLTDMLSKQNAAAVKETLLKSYGIKKTSFTIKKDGFNVQVIDAVLKKIAEKHAETGSEYGDLNAEIQAVKALSLTGDDEKNANLYHRMFAVMEQLLMIGQKVNVHELSMIEKNIQISDLETVVLQFMQIANGVLDKFLYRDVEFYESFMYEFCSQYDDIYWIIEQELQMDIADQYIRHQDYQRGDVNYGYLLRENGIRDKVYSRFVRVYENIDHDKAKGLAHEASRFTSVDSPHYAYIHKIMAS